MRSPGRLLDPIIKKLVVLQAILEALDLIVRLVLLTLLQQVVVVKAILLL